MSDQNEITQRPMLRRLASRLGVLDSYVDQSGERERLTSDATRERLLRALGFDASTEELAEQALRDLRRRRRREWIEPTRVVRQRSRQLARVRTRMPTMHVHEVTWTLALVTEEGVRHEWRGTIPGGRSRKVELTLPIVPPLGYHELHVSFAAEGRTRTGRQRLIVVPSHCMQPETRLGGRRGFGLTTNLYTVRSAENWGAGDFGDVGALATWVGQHGGAFVGTNPLHALRNSGYDVSPYSPITRLFRNPLYLRVTDVPELSHDAPARSLIASPAFQEQLSELRAASMLDYARVMALRTPVLESLHATFVEREVSARTPRARSYAAYLRREDPQLTQFAVFMAIAEEEGPDARQWPDALRHPGSEAVAARGRELSARVDFHRWLQFETDRQLSMAAADASRAGLALGLYQDLAVGSAPSGSDVWSHPALFLHGATVGAPPDMYSDEGQNWGLPAINPHVLHASGYDYWTRLLRAGFRHSGALRIDHALGLFRTFWVPEGESAREGAFVRAYRDELFGILALESLRHGALVVGEDLGTVPPEVPQVFARWGVLSSKVLVFESDITTGQFREAREYPRMALATVNTHDLPPIVGWIEERDIEIRSAVGDLSHAELAASIRDMRRSDRWALVSSLVAAGLLPESAPEAFDMRALIRAVHAFVRRTPSALVGLSLDDLAMESAPVNIPGVWQDKYPSWSRRMREPLGQLLSGGGMEALLGTEGAEGFA